MYDFKFEIQCNDDTERWSIRFYDMEEKEFDRWVVLIMKLRNFLIEREGK